MIRPLGILILLFVSFFTLSCEEDGSSPLNTGSTALTNDEIISGLKQALEVATDTTVLQVNALDGYLKNELIKIAFPSEFQKVADKVVDVSGSTGQKLVDEFVVSMNRAAEDAAQEAKPIFVDAVRKMTINDGKAILTGTDTAATNYLRVNTFTSLQSAFRPKIQTSMEKVKAQQAWKSLTSAYNVLPEFIRGGPAIDTDISNYVTGRALSGLFVVVGQEEKKIRLDPIKRVTDLLQRVFGSLDK